MFTSPSIGTKERISIQIPANVTVYFNGTLVRSVQVMLLEAPVSSLVISETEAVVASIRETVGSSPVVTNVREVSVEDKTLSHDTFVVTSGTPPFPIPPSPVVS